ncbi:MAG TPA: hypothetical protein PK677_16290 [Acidiphilium sp.]|nr:hypothetical protein [Acidiphilium sp.]HQT90072.1 hypothetical protein [Acidiphilium sp.]
MTTLSLHTAPAAPRTQRDQAVAKINFVPPATIIDRDFDIARHVKLIGFSAATAVTLITAAVFLFM